MSTFQTYVRSPGTGCGYLLTLAAVHQNARARSDKDTKTCTSLGDSGIQPE
ncbi:MAG TPA: hypothetical protein VEW46_26325 [Pyrinomonadaceae bacterium]|nr:hypothetical protein [Pyrinomonadaceae bacterium]